jgi:TolA-binding protein
MRKLAAVFIVAAFVLGAAALAGCNAEELKKLQESAQSLTKENQDLRDKVSNLEKAKKAVEDQMTQTTETLSKCQKDIEEAKAATEKKDEKPAAKAAPPPKKEEPKKKGKKKLKPGH